MKACACGCGQPLAGMRSDASYASDAHSKRHRRRIAAYAENDPRKVDAFWGSLFAVRRAARPDKARTRG